MPEVQSVSIGVFQALVIRCFEAIDEFVRRFFVLFLWRAVTIRGAPSDLVFRR